MECCKKFLKCQFTKKKMHNDLIENEGHEHKWNVVTNSQNINLQRRK